MENPTSWIEYLQHPLVLSGFALFLFTGLFKLIKTEKITGKETASLFHKGMNYLFILAIIILIAGFSLSFYQTYAKQKTTIKDSTATSAETQNQLQTQGNQSPAIQSGQDVNINYSGTLSEHSSTNSNNAQKAITPANLKTEGNKSPAINSAGDVNINYGNE